MLSRREVLIGAAAAGAAAVVRGGTTAFAGASQPSTPVNFDVPPGACDTHTHVFGDPQRFPFGAARAYTPEPASVGRCAPCTARCTRTESWLCIPASTARTIPARSTG